MNIDNTILEKSYQTSLNIVQKESKAFYNIFSPLPENTFLQIAPMYAFCQVSFDAVRENTGQKKINQLLVFILDLYAYQANHDWMSKDENFWSYSFADTVLRNQMDKRSFLMLLDGRKDELDFDGFETFDDLVSFARKGMGAFFVMILPLVTNREPSQDLFEASFNLGVGIKITQILLNVGEDFRSRNRLYLPKDLLDHYGLSRQDVEALSQTSEDQIKVPENFILL